MRNLFSRFGILILKGIGHTPFWFLYFISDILFVFNYYIIGYRKKVVFQNLKNSFPEKSEKEIKSIARKYYLHISDLLTETMKFYFLSAKSFSKHLHYKNAELLNELYEQKRSVALISAHYGNWELSMTLPLHNKHVVNGIYRSLKSKPFDRFMKKKRSRFGGNLVASNDLYKTILKQEKKGQLTITYYLSDQTPAKHNQFWTTFLNQETPVYLGSEKIASKLGHAIVFMDVQKVKRGKYEVEFTKLFDDGSKTEPYEITKAHLRKLEEIIIKEPQYWLWSHKRWKHKRPENIPLQ